MKKNRPPRHTKTEEPQAERHTSRTALLAALGTGVVALLGAAAIRWNAARDGASPEATPVPIPSSARPPPSPVPTRDAEVGFSLKTLEHLQATLPAPFYRDVAKARGLDFVHAPDAKLRALRANLEVPVGLEGGGVAVGDYDGDGRDDLFLAGGGGGRLYRNAADGLFTDVTESVGLHLSGESRAPFLVDYDNDGDPDLFVTFVEETCRLFRNDGGRFVDVTRSVGLDAEGHVSHGAVWFDMDDDGLLDLYVARFGHWTKGLNLTLWKDNQNAEPNALYHHVLREGVHSFQEIAADAGVDDHGWTHSVGAWDYDADGHQDLFAVNDFGASHAYRNLGNGRFQNVTKEIGFEGCYNGMNFTLMDVGGRFAFYVSEITTLQDVPTNAPPSARPLPIENGNKLFRATDDGRLEQIQFRVFEPANAGWAWDASAFDYENDGDLDVLVVNGTEEQPPTLPNEARPPFVIGRDLMKHYARERHVFYASEGGYYYDMSRSFAPPAESGVGSSRGVGYIDFDGDGDLDLVINNYDGPASLLENQERTGNHWVRLRLVGTKSSRDPAGARVTLEAGGRTQRAIFVIGSGFLSQKPLWLHFGLGTATRVDHVRIVWPSGVKQTVDGLDVDRVHVITETEE